MQFLSVYFAALFSTAPAKNLKVSVTEDGIAIVRLDLQGSKVNTLNSNLSGEMVSVMSDLVLLCGGASNNVQENDPKVKAAVIISAKEGDFIAGADINMFVAAKVAALFLHRNRCSPARTWRPFQQARTRCSTFSQGVFLLVHNSNETAASRRWPQSTARVWAAAVSSRLRATTVLLHRHPRRCLGSLR